VLLGEEADNYDTNSEYTEPRENGKDHRFKNDDYNTDPGTESQVWKHLMGQWLNTESLAFGFESGGLRLTFMALSSEWL
jgi:hypothetical protein